MSLLGGKGDLTQPRWLSDSFWVEEQPRWKHLQHFCKCVPTRGKFQPPKTWQVCEPWQQTNIKHVNGFISKQNGYLYAYLLPASTPTKCFRVQSQVKAVGYSDNTLRTKKTDGPIAEGRALRQNLLQNKKVPLSGKVKVENLYPWKSYSCYEFPPPWQMNAINILHWAH